MASIVKRGNAYQLRVVHRLLPKPYFRTFDTENEARNEGEKLESVLARGVVPEELLFKPKSSDDPLFTRVITDYTATATAVSEADDALLAFTMKDKPLLGLRRSGVTYRWVESYVAWLKSPEKNLAPGSIVKRIGALGRVLDWHIKCTMGDSPTPIANVIRMLPRGYSRYSANDARVTTVRHNISRNRRLSAAESDRIAAVLAGKKRKDRERAYTEDAAFIMLYAIIVDTGLRLFEAYRLRVDSIDFEHYVFRVDGSKVLDGVVKPRTVPIKMHLREPLKKWCEGRQGLLFPYWDGSKEEKPRVTSKLSRRFKNLFDYADVKDFTQHDLRHEAACRWATMRDDNGGWHYREDELIKIMGWSNSAMIQRYLSYRGEDLSARLG